MRVCTELKVLVERWRGLAPELQQERDLLQTLIVEQAVKLELVTASASASEQGVAHIQARVLEIEQSLIPEGMHQLGSEPSRESLMTWAQAMLQAAAGAPVSAKLACAVLDIASREGKQPRVRPLMICKSAHRCCLPMR
jgi:magnesium chelatase subunit H